MCVDDSVNLESYLVCFAPLSNSNQGGQVVCIFLVSSNIYVGSFVKAITGNGQDVQILTCKKQLRKT